MFQSTIDMSRQWQQKPNPKYIHPQKPTRQWVQASMRLGVFDEERRFCLIFSWHKVFFLQCGLQLWIRTNITMLHAHLTEDALLGALKDASSPVLICDWPLFWVFPCKQCKMGICGWVSLPPSSIINTLIKVVWIFTKWLSLYFYMIQAMMCLHVIGLKWIYCLRVQCQCTSYTYKWCTWK